MNTNIYNNPAYMSRKIVPVALSVFQAFSLALSPINFMMPDRLLEFDAYIALTRYPMYDMLLL